MKQLWLTLLICCLTAGLAQQDLIEYLEEDQHLVYIIDYDRLQEFAELKACTQESFELGLLNSAARTLMLFLPYEAEFYPAVETLEVRAMTQGDIVLLMHAPLREMKNSMSARFRASLQGYASARSGHCFALPYEVIQPWLNVITARGGIIQVNADYLARDIDGAGEIDVSILRDDDNDSAPAGSTPDQADSSENSDASNLTDSTAADPIEQQDVTPEASDNPADTDTTNDTADTLATGAYFVPDGYTLTPFLSDQRILTFDRAGAVIEANHDYLAILETSKGLMILDLDEVNTPRTVNNFIFLALHRYYDGVIFHRVIRNFIAQTGDPSGTGRGGPGYQFADEISPRLRHDEPGIVSMANAGPDTNGSQFFITLRAAQWLDDEHTIFGRLLIGYDVLESINIIDPEEPSVIVPAISTIADIATQGILLEGDAGAAILGYLRESFGAVPNIGEAFDIDGYQGVIGINPETGAPLVGFWAAPDVIERLYIVQREGL